VMEKLLTRPVKAMALVMAVIIFNAGFFILYTSNGSAKFSLNNDGIVPANLIKHMFAH
jgi:hypothetical protein